MHGAARLAKTGQMLQLALQRLPAFFKELQRSCAAVSIRGDAPGAAAAKRGAHRRWHKRGIKKIGCKFCYPNQDKSEVSKPLINTADRVKRLAKQAKRKGINAGLDKESQ